MTLPAFHSYLFFLGRTPALSLAELSACFHDQSFKTITESIVQTTFDGAFSAKECIVQLGGTVKIVQIIDEVKTISPEYLATQFFTLAKDKKISYGVSSVGTPTVGIDVLQHIKELLTLQGLSSRYVLSKHGEISSVVVEKQDVAELVLLAKNKDNILVGHTVAVQPFEEWSKRDYSRPFADPKAGMLPPKVARMAINISNLTTSSTILDPFCGMGTILGEALLLGHKAIGSDNNTDVIHKVQKNLEWLSSIYSLPSSSYKVFVSDATHVSNTLEAQSVDAVITEPFLGNVAFDKRKTQNIIKGLEKLYIGCLKDWHKVLRPGGKVVMALPKYIVQKREYFVKTVIDRCENLGYTIQLGPIEYSRPQAVVRREFYVFKKLN